MERKKDGVWLKQTNSSSIRIGRITKYCAICETIECEAETCAKNGPQKGGNKYQSAGKTNKRTTKKQMERGSNSRFRI